MALFKYSTNAKEKYPSYQDFDKAKYLVKEIYTSGDKMKAIKTENFCSKQWMCWLEYMQVNHFDKKFSECTIQGFNTLYIGT